MPNLHVERTSRYSTTGSTPNCRWQKHVGHEFRQFLDRIEERGPSDLHVHLILDNYGTHKNPLILRWLLKRSRFHLHFAPTGSSWINLVERWFAVLTDKQLRCGSRRNTVQLKAAILEYLDVYNENPKPFV